MSELVISQDLVKQMVDRTVENFIVTAIESLQQDIEWIRKIEQLINQNVVQQTVARISSIDANTVIQKTVTDTLDSMKQDIAEQVLGAGIKDSATAVELTVIDGHVVVENAIDTPELTVINTATINNLAVLGTINVDNASWGELTDHVANRALTILNKEWRDELVTQVTEQIISQGINFSSIVVDSEPLLTNGVLAKTITHSNLQTVGILEGLTVAGDAQLGNTLHVINKRIGINTSMPEMALSIWDEDVNLVAGKSKANTAYVGTSRNQNLVLGVNRNAQITLDVDGLTTVNKLQVGVHKISHDVQLPGYEGTRGDIVFNALPSVSNTTFAWVCLGGFKWKEIKLS